MNPRAAAWAVGVALVASVGLAGCAPAGVEPSAPPSSAAATTTPSAPASATSPPRAAARPRYLPSVGECFDVRKDQRDPRDGLVPCSEEHDDEVYAVVELADGAFPGDAAVLDQALEACAVPFAAFIGIPADESALEITTYDPTADDWASGDRRVACVVWNPTDTVVGSLQGAGY